MITTTFKKANTMRVSADTRTSTLFINGLCTGIPDGLYLIR